MRRVVAADPVGSTPVDPDRARVGAVEAHEELAQRALAAARRADERDDLTGRELKLTSVQHRFAGGYAYASPSRLDLGRAGRRRARGRAGVGSGAGGEHPVEPLGGDDRTRHLLEQEADDAHREREQREQRHRLHDVAR